MSEILFSVIVPIYKVEKYLCTCVDSILAQTYSNFELILVDDGSPDNCPSICDKYADNDTRIKVVHKENGGIVSARQSGVAVAQGDYVICIDGDDWIAPTYLQEFQVVIDRTGADIICCGYYEAYEYKNIPKSVNMPSGFYDKKKMQSEIYPCLIEQKNGKYFSPHVWAKAFKRTIYQRQQQIIDTVVNIGEDHACTKPTIYHSDSIFIMDNYLYYYRQVDTSMTKARKAFTWDGPKLIGQHLERQIPMNEGDFQEQVDRLVVHLLFNVCITQYNRYEKRSIIRKDIKNNLRDSYYLNAIKMCKYPMFTKGWLAKIVLWCRMYGLMNIYNKYRHW